MMECRPQNPMGEQGISRVIETATSLPQDGGQMTECHPQNPMGEQGISRVVETGTSPPQGRGQMTKCRPQSPMGEQSISWGHSPLISRTRIHSANGVQEVTEVTSELVTYLSMCAGSLL